jgi:hypothetical protein
MEAYLVHVGQRNPLSIHADSPKAAAFQASMELVTRNIAQPRSMIVVGEEGATLFRFADRKCRKCGWEEHACKEICCWMAWDLCSNCVE